MSTFDVFRSLETTMDPRIEISTFDGGLELFKLPRTWPRDLSVQVSLSGVPKDILKVDFPRNQERIAISDLLPNLPHSVEVLPRNFLRRIIRGVHRQSVLPEIAPFRIVITGSGRCGTTTLAEYLNGMSFDDGERVIARHETLNEYILPWILDKNHQAISRFMTGQLHNVESAPYFAHVPHLVEGETVVHLVRDGRRVCQSGIIRQWYESDTVWNRIKPDFEGTTFEKICHFWRHTNEQVEKIANVFVRLEDLADDHLARQKFLTQLGLRSQGQTFPHANRGKAPSHFESWTPEMRSDFTRICGEMMDQYYPGWRETW